MSYHCLPELVGEYSEDNYSAGQQYVQSKKTPTVEKYCLDGKETVCYPCSQSGTISKPSTELIGKWISSQQAFLANHLAQQVENSVQKMNEISGPILLESSEKVNQDTSYSKTSQDCFLLDISEQSLKTYPKAGMMLDGNVWRRNQLVPLTKEKDSGLWPTPKSSPSGPDYARINRPKSGGDDLVTRVARGIETPPYTLNPAWVEWLMGFPIGWTDLRPLEMLRYRLWLKLFGIYSNTPNREVEHYNTSRS